MITFDEPLSQQKEGLLDYFRGRAAESLEIIKGTFGVNQFKERAAAINKEITQTEYILLQNLRQEARSKNWSNAIILDSILMLSYTKNVAMIESRNEVWPYEYMAFSRRIGELWEPFCKLCFEYSVNNIKLFVPPLFSEVRRRLHHEIDDYIEQLNITNEQKLELKRYYNKVWALVDSGEIKLELDLHFIFDNRKINVDFKSGFSSNEKGNTNRLLMVATIYKNLDENYSCVILTRSNEDRNNHYFQTLKNSGVWSAYCGEEAYQKIDEYTGFNLKSWIEQHINWINDLREDTRTYLINNRLDQYLLW